MDLKEYLLSKYPHGMPLVTDFCAGDPDLLKLRTARRNIDRLESLPEELRRCYRKRAGRWHLDVLAYCGYMMDERPIIENTAA